jgi:DNA-binding winged helix-turn-helix (wHTH) protein/Tfp pilus assembly protein PilF/TolB-like protein
MARRKFAFGEFTFETETGTLSRRSRGWHLPEQTARLLEILLERANTLVTREELRRVLWPNEEFLDYDQGINVAVNRLRNALRDDPRNPQFLETIPKRGYSFRGEVTEVPVALAASAVAVEPVEILPALAPEAEAAAAPSSPNGLTLAAVAELPAEAPLIEASRGTRLSLMPWGWVVVVVALAAAAVWYAGFRRPKPLAAHVLRLGIAPLQVAGDPQAGDLGESFRLSLSDAMSRVPRVQVCAAGAFESSRSILDIPRVSQELKLDDMLLGSIVKQGDGYDLKFELVRAADAIHLASFEYSGNRQDFPSIRERLQRDVFYYLQSGAPTVQATNGSTNDAQAYELYLQGTYLMFPRDPNSLHQALDALQQAIARDPGFAAAYSATAAAYLKLSVYKTAPGDQPLRQAEVYARRAIQLDPVLAQAHAVLGFCSYAHDWNFDQGESELRYAIQLDPTQADYHDWLAVLLVERGNFDEGMNQIALAHADNPRWPAVYAMEGLVGGYARRNQQALAAAKTYLELLPSLPLAHNTMAWVDFQAGHYREAVEEWRQMAVLQNDDDRVRLEDEGLEILRTRGIRAYARLRLDAIRTKRGTAQWNDFVPAEWYACAGDREQTMAQLEQLVASHDRYTLSIAVNPLFDAYHEDPRFIAMLANAGLSVPESLRGVNSHLCESSDSDHAAVAGR